MDKIVKAVMENSATKKVQIDLPESVSSESSSNSRTDSFTSSSDASSEEQRDTVEELHRIGSSILETTVMEIKPPRPRPSFSKSQSVILTQDDTDRMAQDIRRQRRTSGLKKLLVSFASKDEEVKHIKQQKNVLLNQLNEVRVELEDLAFEIEKLRAAKNAKLLQRDSQDEHAQQILDEITHLGSKSNKKSKAMESVKQEKKLVKKEIIDIVKKRTKYIPLREERDRLKEQYKTLQSATNEEAEQSINDEINSLNEEIQQIESQNAKIRAENEKLKSSNRELVQEQSKIIGKETHLTNAMQRGVLKNSGLMRKIREAENLVNVSQAEQLLDVKLTM